MLLLSPNRTVTTGRLIDAVWEDRPPTRALSQLHACVSRLRARLAAGGLPRGLIATAPAGAGYSITVDRDDLDSLVFGWRVRLAREAMAGNQREPARRHYREALELWRGPALDGVGGPTLRRLAAGLDEQRLRVQQDCLTLELGLGMAAEILPELTDLATRHPYHETVHRLLMLALYRAGRQADSAEAYRRYERALREEVGTEVGEPLRQLHQAILRRDPGLELAPATPANDAPRIPHELPTRVTGFTGRADALAALTKARPGDPAGPVTVLAITGSPGVGKTALAVHWAHRSADRFPDGQLFVNLRGSHPTGALRPVEALAAMLRSLGQSADEIPDDEQQSAALFRSMLAGRHALVLLDDAGSAEQVRPLLPGSGSCTVLVTSRDRLGGLVAHEGARRLPLDVLPSAEAVQLLARLLGESRVSAEADAATELADACARLPLALRIAAAHLADRPATTIADYLTELRSGDRLAALQMDGDRASSVSAALGLSYQALPPDAARMLRLLGLVPGTDFTAAVAASLVDTGRDDAARTLARLARSSLLTEPASGRYAFHDLLREFAVQLSESTDSPHEREAAWERLLRHYLHHAEAAAAIGYAHMLRLPIPVTGAGAQPIELDSGIDNGEAALAWLDAERPNLVAAVTTAARHGPPRYAWLLADRLRGYFWYTRHMPDWLAVASTALATAEQQRDLHGMAAAQVSLADAYQASDRHEESIPHYLRAADLARQARWFDCEAVALNNLGLAYTELGMLTEGAELYQRLLLLGHHTGQPDIRARHLQNLAVIEWELGRLDDAHAHYTEALEFHNAAGGRLGSFAALAGLAVLESARGHGDQALELAAAAVDFAAGTGNPHDQLAAANALGVANRESGQPREAVELHQRAHAIALGLNDTFRQAEALGELAEAHLYAGDLDQASSLADQALALMRSSGANVLEGATLNTLAEARYRQGRLDLADQHAQEALARHRKAGQRRSEARTLAILALVCRDSGQPREAARYRRLAHDLYAEMGAVFPDRLRTP